MITHNKVRMLIPLSVICLSFASGINFQDKEELKNLDRKMETFERSMENWEVQMDRWGNDLEKSIKSGQTEMQVPPIPSTPSYEEYEDISLKLGLYIENLDFEDAYRRHYPECYGVLVTGVVKGGNADRAGLIKDDIIMEFGGEKVRYESHLLNLRDSKKIGDSVPIKYFRNENVIETVLTFAPPSESDKNNSSWSDLDEFGKTTKFSVGYGGGGPLGVWVNYDLTKLNNFIDLYGFKPINKNSLVFFGGYGMGNIGDGFFIGGMGIGLKFKTKFSYDDPATPETENYSRLLNIESGFGGVTLVKKLPMFSSNVIVDFGTTIGGGNTIIEVAQSDGSYSWDNPSLEAGPNWSARFEKKYMVLYPTIGIMFRIKSWLGLHASTGYLWNYSVKDNWNALPFEYEVQGQNEPDAFNGQTVEVGIWFGN